MWVRIWHFAGISAAFRRHLRGISAARPRSVVKDPRLCPIDRLMGLPHRLINGDALSID